MEGDAESLGEAEWLHRVVRDLERPLSRYALSITHNPEQALDAVQETFLLLVQNLAKVDRVCPAPWLYTVCRSKAIDLLRRDAKMEPHSYEEIAQHPSASPSADSAAQSREDREEAERLVARLPPQEQEAVRLKFQEGLRYKDIAAVMGLSVSHVGVLIHKAVARVREWRRGPSSQEART